MFFFFQAEDGIRDLVRSRGLGDVYKRQVPDKATAAGVVVQKEGGSMNRNTARDTGTEVLWSCLLYTSDAADERSSVDLGGRRIIKKKSKR